MSVTFSEWEGFIASDHDGPGGEGYCCVVEVDGQEVGTLRQSGADYFLDLDDGTHEVIHTRGGRAMAQRRVAEWFALNRQQFPIVAMGQILDAWENGKPLPDVVGQFPEGWQRSIRAIDARLNDPTNSEGES